MRVFIAECLSGARKAGGVVVVIDVFRAFSTACYAVENNAGPYFAVDAVETAQALARERDAVLMGERGGVMVKGFDHGNSPTEIENVDFGGRAVVHTTSAGTQGLLACRDAEVLMTGAFVNAGAVVKRLKALEPEVVTLVAMGTGGEYRAQEDMMCAMYIKNELDGFPNSFKTLRSFLSNVDSSVQFFDPEQTHAPERDFELCLDLDRFDFVLEASPYRDGAVRLTKTTLADEGSA